MKYKIISDMLYDVCQKADKLKPAFVYRNSGEYISVYHSDLIENVEQFAISLMELGVRKGDRVGLIGENSIKWIISSFSINLIGAVDVPLFPILTSRQILEIFNDCEVSSVIVSNNLQLQKILDIKDELTSLRQIIIFSDKYDSKDVFIHSFEHLINRGKITRTAIDRKKILNDNSQKIRSDDLITLIYTSGTTGKSKGVMLTHRNIISNFLACTEAFGDFSHDTSLMFLPLCHSYERTTGFYTLFYSQTKIFLADSIDTVPQQFNEVKPTLITSVPKLLETVRKKVLNNIQKESKAKQKIFSWAIEVGKKKFINDTNKKFNPIINAEYKLAEKLVYSKVRERLGGRLKKVISGGAPLQTEVELFFGAIGIHITQGYGLTETSPVVSANRFNEIEIGTIGKPLPGVDVKLAVDGEILVKGPNVMKGYWNDPVSTKQTIDEEGWLYTGDIGVFTNRGNLKITDRKKNLFVSSGGKNIAPQPIESLITQSRFIEHCILIGDNREYITALISPNFEQLENLAREFDIEYNSLSELITNQKIINHLKEEIDYYQKDVSKFEKIRKFRILSEPFSTSGGELSPKLSIKRFEVEKKYSYLIESMYD